MERHILCLWENREKKSHIINEQQKEKRVCNGWILYPHLEEHLRNYYSPQNFRALKIFLYPHIKLFYFF